MALLIVILGYSLRAYHVAAPSLRGDEAFSVSFSAQPVGAILAALAHAEPNPPLYWLLLHAWMPVAGNSELAVRWLSVLSGAVAVALTYRLGRALTGRRAGLLAASLAAISPFLVWYSQDARAYSLLTALVLGAAWQTWRAVREDRTAHWLAAGLLWWLALFTHYFAAFSLAAVGAAVVLAPESRARWRRGIALAAGIGAAYLPWAVYVAPLMAGHSKGWIGAAGFGEAAWRLLTAFSVGTQAGTLPRLIGGILLGLLLVTGVAMRARHRSGAPSWVFAIGTGMPALVWLVSLVRPVFLEQYVIASLPGALLIAASGASNLAAMHRRGKWLSGTVVIALVMAGLLSLNNYYFNPAYAKSPNWRGVVEYLEATARPNEVVVLNLPDPSFYYYYHGPMPVEASPPDAMGAVGPGITEAQLQTLRDRFDHIRFFFSPSPLYDPDGFVGKWLESCCEKTGDTFVHGQRVQAYDTPRGSLAARQAYPVEFEDGVGLTGFRVVNPQVRPGESIHLTLYWTARESIARSYTVFTHFTAPDGYYVAGADSLPASGRRPTGGWVVGEAVIDPHLIPIPADTPAGEYRLSVGMYLPETSERLVRRDSPDGITDRVVLPITVSIVAP